MPRKSELTFQKGTDGRAGRWRKIYRGKTHYLGSGRCKTDAASYKAALAAWRKLKVQLDAENIAVPRPRDQEYDQVIREWELVLSWSVEHGADEEAAIARDKLVELRHRREQRRQPPVSHKDRLWSRFRPNSEVLEEIGELASAHMGPEGLDEFRTAMLQKSSDFPITFSSDLEAPDDVTSWRRAEIQWEDRIQNQRQVAASTEDQTLGGWSEVYLNKLNQRVNAKDLSVGRYMAERTTLEHFRDWAGAHIAVATISGQMLSRFHAHQLELIARDQCAPNYARDRIRSVRSFIRWLWTQDVLEKLPKNIDSRELKIGDVPLIVKSEVVSL